LADGYNKPKGIYQTIKHGLSHIFWEADTITVEFFMASISLAISLWLVSPLAHVLFGSGVLRGINPPHIFGAVLFLACMLKYWGVFTSRCKVRISACFFATVVWTALFVQFLNFYIRETQGSFATLISLLMAATNMFLAVRLGSDEC
jgi:hypothetical protein